MGPKRKQNQNSNTKASVKVAIANKNVRSSKRKADETLDKPSKKFSPEGSNAKLKSDDCVERSKAIKSSKITSRRNQTIADEDVSNLRKGEKKKVISKRNLVNKAAIVQNTKNEKDALNPELSIKTRPIRNVPTGKKSIDDSMFQGASNANSEKVKQINKMKFKDGSCSKKVAVKNKRSSLKVEHPKEKGNAHIRKVHEDVETVGDGCDSSSSESEWEDVAEEPVLDIEDYNPVIPNGGVEITLEGPTMPRKRQKKTFDMMEYIRLEMNRGKKEQQLIVHQVHLLCLLARGLFVNKVLNSDELGAFALSLLPDEWTNVDIKRKGDTEFIRKLLVWFRSTFIVAPNFKSSKAGFKSAICKCFEYQKAPSSTEYNMMFIVLARTLGLNVRMCLSFYPISYKAKDLLKKGKLEDMVCENKKTVDEKSEGDSSKSGPTKKAVPDKKGKKKQNPRPSKNVKSGSNKATDIKERKLPKRAMVKKTYHVSSDDDADDVARDESFLPKNSSSSDDEPERRPGKQSSKRLSKEKSKKSNRKILSSDSSPSSREMENHERGVECWAEVYSKKEEKWVSVECLNDIFNKPYHIEKLATQPVSYVVCFDNFSFIKDVTKRYGSQWMTCTRKLRVVPDWWKITLVPFLPPDTAQHRDEESQMEATLLRKPMPSTIGEFKSHPLYALKRHLLKFEAIYPPDAPSIGFVRGEPVYARDCVHNLHSRETWLKEARLVRIGEEPYKIVKARPKYDRLTGTVTTDLPLNLFGRWQTEDYMPPIAWNGKVPRNEYGNVELFKPCMLPIGTVHLRNPGLNRVAKKLDIDCSPAVVGFDGHKGSIHPVFDGFIVCEEFKDTLLSAWEEEQENIRKREEEKKDKRVYGNWKRLIKGLLIREHIKEKYMNK